MRRQDLLSSAPLSRPMRSGAQDLWTADLFVANLAVGQSTYQSTLAVVYIRYQSCKSESRSACFTTFVLVLMFKSSQTWPWLDRHQSTNVHSCVHLLQLSSVIVLKLFSTSFTNLSVGQTTFVNTCSCVHSLPNLYASFAKVILRVVVPLTKLSLFSNSPQQPSF